MKKPNQKSLQAWKLKESIDKKTIDLDAPYQRGVVWGPQKMSDLIDSLLFNFYVPPLIFAVRKIGNRYHRTCVDGKQRLTSIARFMNNEIPYYDRSVDPPIPKYFSLDLDKSKPDGDIIAAGRHYLSDDEVIRFNQVELICVDYSQLTEDDEYDVFSRVQKGVQISPAEKLRAHNTAVAKKIRELADKYTDISQIFPTLGNLATLFKTIAEFFVALDSEPGEFRVTSTKVADYIKSTGTLKADIVHQAEIALGLLKRMINYGASFGALTRYPEQTKKKMVKIELLTLLYYLSKCDQHRSLDELAEDCNDMRAMFHRHEQRLYLGARMWAVGQAWCKQKWEENQQSKQEMDMTDEDDDGDNAFLQNSDTNLFGNQSYQLLQGQQAIYYNGNMANFNLPETFAPSSNRRRLLNQNRNSSRPVAKRGAKIPRFS